MKVKIAGVADPYSSRGFSRWSQRKPFPNNMRLSPTYQQSTVDDDGHESSIVPVICSDHVKYEVRGQIFRGIEQSQEGVEYG